MEKKRTLKRGSIPQIERHSFYENDILYETLYEDPLTRQQELEKYFEREKKYYGRQQEFTTFYMKFEYDQNGNCKMTPRPYDEDV